MTYILGARCNDGVMLIADRKLSRAQGADNYDNKIFEDIPFVVVAASGVVGLYDKFRVMISQKTSEEPDMTPIDFIQYCEKLVYWINREYSERTGGETVELLLAYAKNKYANLQYIVPEGVGEIVKKYQVLGSGEPYGTYILRKKWHENITMEEAAVLGYFIIKLIEHNALDEGVGVGNAPPQIWYIPDQPDAETLEKMSTEEQAMYDIRELNGSELSNIHEQSKAMLSSYEQAVLNL